MYNTTGNTVKHTVIS